MRLIFVICILSICLNNIQNCHFSGSQCLEEASCSPYQNCIKVNSSSALINCFCVAKDCTVYNNKTGECNNCSSPYALTETGKFCVSPIANCSVYFDNASSIQCKNCTTGYDLYDSKTCVPKIENCQEYSQSGKCKLCNPGYTAQNGTACMPNISHCLRLSRVDITQCTDCESGYFVSYNSSNCFPYITNCTSYDEETGDCLICKGGTVASFTGRSCPQDTILYCQFYSDSGRCLVCLSNMVPTETRLKCAAPTQNCMVYDDNTTECKECKENYTARFDGLMMWCFQKIANCKRYNDSNVTVILNCSECDNTFILNSNKSKCIKETENCAENYLINDTLASCNNCLNGFNFTKTKKKCAKSVDFCISYNDLTGKCDECIKGKNITFDNRCEDGFVNIPKDKSNSDLNNNNNNLILEITLPVVFVVLILVIALVIYCKKKKLKEKKGSFLKNDLETLSNVTFSDLSNTISIGSAIQKIGEFIEREKWKLEHFVFEIIESDGSFTNPTQIKVIEKIGKGGFGTVYKGKDYIETVYALKIFLDKNGSDVLNEQDLHRFQEMLKEKLHLRDFKHENIIALSGIVYCFNPEKLILGIVEPFMQYDLKNFLKSKKKSLSFERKIEIAVNIAKGLNYMHYRKCSHNDIKPQNILINWENETTKIEVKLSDFGTVQNSFFTMNQNLGLTLEYAAPERILRFLQEKELTKEILIKSDIWSFGCVLIKIFSNDDEEGGKKLSFPWSPFLEKSLLNFEDAKENIKNFIYQEESVENKYFTDKNAPENISKMINDCLQVDIEKRPKIEKILELLSNFS